ncbi:MAG: hypothetical protein BWY31_02270 [Lentisphaerae bacterium ADurb.Bin242]|nr:MAG: hypothetical protein BWY31_02270 [Lentisphaerae bacterium ADurb.Bin242]
MRQKYFSMIELLIVIAVIAILVSMLLPALSKVKAAAQQISCCSNIRQFQSGFTMYALDYRDFVVNFNTTSFQYNDGNINWLSLMLMEVPRQGHYAGAGKFLGYVKAEYNEWKGISQCPAQARDYSKETRISGLTISRNIASPYGFFANWKWRVNPYQETGVSFSFSPDLTAYQEPVFINVGKLKNPSALANLGEVPNYTSYKFLFVHGMTKTNFAFFDGHVQSVKLSEIKPTTGDLVCTRSGQTEIWPWNGKSR